MPGTGLRFLIPYKFLSIWFSGFKVNLIRAIWLDRMAEHQAYYQQFLSKDLHVRIRNSFHKRYNWLKCANLYQESLPWRTGKKVFFPQRTTGGSVALFTDVHPSLFVSELAVQTSC